MNKGLIPKSLSNQKLTIFKNFTFYDLALVIIYIVISFGISTGLTFVSSSFRMIIGVTIFFVLLLSLFNNKYYHLKNYEILVHSFNFIAQKKSYIDTSTTKNKKSKDKNNDTALLVPYKQITENFIETDKLDGGLQWYIGAIEIKGFNISSLGYEEQMLKVSEVQALFKFLDCQVSLVKIDQPVDNNSQISTLKNLKIHLDDLHTIKKVSSIGLKNRLAQIDGYITNYKNNSLTTSRRFYLFLYHNNHQELKKLINLAESKLLDASLKPLICNKYQLVNTIKAIFNPFETPFSTELIDQYSNDLKTLLKFNKINFHKDYFKISNIYYSVNAIHDYPTFPRNGWGANLANNPTTMIWNINSTNQDEIKEQLHKAIINVKTNMLSTKKIVDKSEKDYQINAFYELVERLTSGEEIIKKCNVLFLNYGINLKNLKTNQLNLKQVLRENSIIIDNLQLRQKLGFSAILPKPTDPLSEKFSREMPSMTLALSFPFINNDLNDEKGLFMGVNVTGDLITFNQFQEDYHRKNFNQLLLGTSGSGKSHTGKKQVNWHISNGRKVIIIDPEREYQNLCNYHDGNWIDVGSGSSGYINPLQIFNSLAENENNNMIISNYLQTLEYWFSIILPDLNANELRYLMQKINNLYTSFNLIDDNLNKLEATSFPIFNNLLSYMKKEDIKTETHKKIIDIIELEFTGNGKYAQLYNHHSTLKLNSNLLTVFDINNLFEKGNNKIIQAQLFLILAYIQHEVKINSFNDTNEIIILIDEAHLIIDKDNPAGLNFMFQMVKRIRKRRGGIILITQNPDDFLGSPEIRKKTTAMMNNTQYSLVLNLSPQNLKDINELFKAYGGLSYQENNFIAKAKRGQALFVISGFNRHCIQIEISPLELQAFNNTTLIK